MGVIAPRVASRAPCFNTTVTTRSIEWRPVIMPSVSFLPFLQTVPWGTRCLTVVVIISSLSYYAVARYVARDAAVPPNLSDVLPWVVLTPGVSWKYPWTLLTAGFVEITWIEVRFWRGQD